MTDIQVWISDIVGIVLSFVGGAITIWIYKLVERFIKARDAKLAEKFLRNSILNFVKSVQELKKRGIVDEQKLKLMAQAHTICLYIVTKDLLDDSEPDETKYLIMRLKELFNIPEDFQEELINVKDKKKFISAIQTRLAEQI